MNAKISTPDMRNPEALYTRGLRRWRTLASCLALSGLLTISAHGQDPSPTPTAFADLTVSKTGPAEAQAGSDVTYTIEVRNLGPDAASVPTLQDTLPEGTTFVSLSSPMGWSCETPAPGAPGTVTCSSNTLPTDFTAIFTLVLKLDAEAAAGSTYTNVAIVTGETFDPNDENNSAAASTSVPGSPADLDLGKSVDSEATLPDSDLTYTINIFNVGPNTATSASWSDTLPDNSTFVSLKQTHGPAWSCTTPAIGAGGTVTCTNSSVAVNVESQWELVVHIPDETPAGTVYTNTATVVSSEDPNGENDSQSVSTQVFAAAPTLTTTASASVTIGGSISDTAVLSGGTSPLGTITFRAYGPDDAQCAGTPAFTSTVPVNGNSTYNSAVFTPTVAGTYRFVASYSGDGNNIGTANACNDPAESVVVTKAAPTISTTASGPVTAGSGTVFDRATLANGFAPTGTITFRLFGPSDSTCSATPVFSSTISVNGNGQYESGSFTPMEGGTYRWVASYSGDANNTAVSGACGDAGESVTVAPSPSPSPSASPSPSTSPSPSASPTPSPSPSGTPSDVLNLSTRARLETGENVIIGGFIITGSSSKRLVVRALGPSLQDNGVSDFLPDPLLTLHRADGSVLTSNDNWKDDPAQATQLQTARLAPTNDLESALATTLVPGTYTAIGSGKGSATGIALVEIYDIDNESLSALANISTRALVQAGENVMIGGFTLGRSATAANVVVRAIGPSLERRGIARPLADPTLELRNSNGEKIASNDNWADDSSQAAAIMSYGLAPENDSESALAATLAAGGYTAIVAGKNDGVGVALVEIYRVQ